MWDRPIGSTAASVCLGARRAARLARPDSALCPVLCPPPNPTEYYRMKAGRCQMQLHVALIALSSNSWRSRQVVDSSCDQSLQAGGRRFDPGHVHQLNLHFLSFALLPLPTPVAGMLRCPSDDGHSDGSYFLLNARCSCSMALRSVSPNALRGAWLPSIKTTIFICPICEGEMAACPIQSPS